jgi:hypothetical protein
MRFGTQPAPQPSCNSCATFQAENGNQELHWNKENEEMLLTNTSPKSKPQLTRNNPGYTEHALIVDAVLERSGHRRQH